MRFRKSNPQKYQNICGTKFSRYLFSARSEFGIFIVFFNEVFSSYVIRVNCVSYMLLSVSMFFLRVCNATRYNTVLFNMSDAEDSNVRSRPNPEVVDSSIGAAIQAAVTRSIGSLTDNLTQVIESRLTDFAKRFSEENSSSVEQAVKKARREQYTCKRKDNQQQLDHSLQVLDKLDEASDALKHKSYEKVKAALESGTELVSKRVKAIKLADKSEFGWATVNEYLSDELASDSDDYLRREFTGPRGELRERSLRKNVVVPVLATKAVAPPLHLGRLRQDTHPAIWFHARRLDQLVVWVPVLR